MWFDGLCCVVLWGVGRSKWVLVSMVCGDGVCVGERNVCGYYWYCEVMGRVVLGRCCQVSLESVSDRLCVNYTGVWFGYNGV